MALKNVYVVISPCDTEMTTVSFTYRTVKTLICCYRGK